MNSSFVTRHEVVVVGAGAVGAATALALANARIDVGVVDARAAQPFDAHDYDARVYALAPSSAALFARSGVWDEMRARRVSPYARMRVWEHGESDEIAFDAALIGAPELGYIVEDQLLRDVMWQALQRHPQITVHCPVQLAGHEVDPDSAAIRLEDGRMLRAELLVAADGAGSPLREMAGVEIEASDPGERAVVAHVSTERPHQATAWQRFTPSGPLAFLPLADGRSSIVWSLKQAEAEAVLRLDDGAFRERVGRAFGWRLGQVTAAGPRVAFPLRTALAQSFIAPRLALVGDAAHVVHPLAGQGLNLGLLDAAALADTLAHAHEVRHDLGAVEVLQRYDSWRRGDVAIAAKSFEWLDGLFRSDLPGIGSLRRAGLALADRVEPLKRQFALAASGWTGRVPRLAARAAATTQRTAGK
jgi:ubiquinone biosynthesis UbiH/UbiF/VisC/COQ6 family hydroxylase